MSSLALTGPTLPGIWSGQPAFAPPGRTEDCRARAFAACVTLRLILIGSQAQQLLESDTVLKLNAPSAIKDTSWIKPGKTTFPWWNDFYEVGVPFKKCALDWICCQRSAMKPSNECAVSRRSGAHVFSHRHVQE